MGCDIHIFVEKKVDDKWITVNTMNGHHRQRWSVKDGGTGWSSPAPLSRNYIRFAALAGVRGDGPVAKGLPSDISETCKYYVDKWDSYGHSHSWLPLKEAAKVFLETERDPTEYISKFPESYFFEVDDENFDNYRVVFWFDN